MENTVKRKKPFYLATTNHFEIERYKTDIPFSMPNFHYHNRYELYYLIEGERYYFIKDNTYAVKSGSFVLVDKNDIHCTGTLNNAGYDRIVIYFDDYFLKAILNSEGCDDLLSCFKKNFGTVEISEPNRRTVESLLFSILSEYDEKENRNELFIKSALIQLLCLITKESFTHINSESDRISTPHKTASKIIGYINNYYFEDITLDFLSEKFYISPFYLSRTFKKVCGISFVDYLNNVRIKEAKKLLINTKMSITEISSAVGYKNNTHFGRVFKNITALSPLTYRKRHK